MQVIFSRSVSLNKVRHNPFTHTLTHLHTHTYNMAARAAKREARLAMLKKGGAGSHTMAVAARKRVSVEPVEPVATTTTVTDEKGSYKLVRRGSSGKRTKFGNISNIVDEKITVEAAAAAAAITTQEGGREKVAEDMTVDEHPVREPLPAPEGGVSLDHIDIGDLVDSALDDPANLMSPPRVDTILEEASEGAVAQASSPRVPRPYADLSAASAATAAAEPIYESAPDVALPSTKQVVQTKMTLTAAGIMDESAIVRRPGRPTLLLMQGLDETSSTDGTNESEAVEAEAVRVRALYATVNRDRPLTGYEHGTPVIYDNVIPAVTAAAVTAAAAVKDKEGALAKKPSAVGPELPPRNTPVKATVSAAIGAASVASSSSSTNHSTANAKFTSATALPFSNCGDFVQPTRVPHADIVSEVATTPSSSSFLTSPVDLKRQQHGHKRSAVPSKEQGVLVSHPPVKSIAECIEDQLKLQEGATNMMSALGSADVAVLEEPLKLRLVAQRTLQVLEATPAAAASIGACGSEGAILPRRLTLTEMSVPLHWWSSIPNKDTSSFSFFAVVSTDSRVLATDTIKVDAGTLDQLVFPHKFVFDHLCAPSDVTVAFYCRRLPLPPAPVEGPMTPTKRALAVAHKGAKVCVSSSRQLASRLRHSEVAGSISQRVKASTPKRLGRALARAKERVMELRKKDDGNGGMTAGATGSQPVPVPQFELVGEVTVPFQALRDSPAHLWSTTETSPVGDHVAFDTELEKMPGVGSDIVIEGALTFSVLDCGTKRGPTRKWERRWARLNADGILESWREMRPASGAKADVLLALDTSACVRKLTRRECARGHTLVLEEGGPTGVELLRVSCDSRDEAHAWESKIADALKDLKTWRM